MTDNLELTEVKRPFDLTAITWLIGQGVEQLNTAGKSGEVGYKYVTKQLRRCDGAAAEVTQLIKASPKDVSLRWNLLFVLGDIADHASVDFLTHYVMEQLPEREEGCCEGARDEEVLVRTMAIKALCCIANRHPEATQSLVKIVSERPPKPLLIEAVKAAISLGEKDAIAQLLPENDLWILDLREACADELDADPERMDTKERGFTPPNEARHSLTPRSVCQTTREG